MITTQVVCGVMMSRSISVTKWGLLVIIQ